MDFLPPEERKSLIETTGSDLSIGRQSELLGISRSTVYYVPRINTEDFHLMNRIDEIYTECPFYGKRRIRQALIRLGYKIGIDRTRTLMKKMGIQAIYPKPKTSIPNKEHQTHPYLLKGLIISGSNQVWGADITYIRLAKGWAYLMAILDWYSRYVIAWRLSNTMETDFCTEALEEALRKERTDIFNTDQGSQFTSTAFTGILKNSEIQISMDGRGRAMDNIFTERLWRSVKYEEVYIKEYSSFPEAHYSLKQYFNFYNNKRFHQSLSYLTPAKVHFGENMGDIYNPSPR